MTWVARNLNERKNCFFGCDGGVSKGKYKGLNVNTKSQDNKKDIADWDEDPEMEKLGIAYAKAAAEFTAQRQSEKRGDSFEISDKGLTALKNSYMLNKQIAEPQNDDTDMADLLKMLLDNKNAENLFSAFFCCFYAVSRYISSRKAIALSWILTI